MEVNARPVSNNARWYAVHTKPRQEERAESNLRLSGVETFAPSIRERRAGQAYVSTYVTKPLFPRYLFAKFVASEMLHHVSYTRGVNGVVNFGDGPAPIEDSVIELIQSQAAEDGYIKIVEEFEPGNKVLVINGPFANLAGIFERKMKSTDRVMVLLAAVQYQSHVLVNIEQLKKI